MSELPDWRQACGWLEEYEHYLKLTAEANTMDINQAFPSKYLKAADLQGKTLKVVIEDVSRIEEGEGDLKGKFALNMVGKEKQMVLNKTNAMVIAGVFGPETDGWRGKELVLFSEKVQFQGQMVDALRVRPHQEVSDDTDIPF